MCILCHNLCFVLVCLVLVCLVCLCVFCVCHWPASVCLGFRSSPIVLLVFCLKIYLSLPPFVSCSRTYSSSTYKYVLHSLKFHLFLGVVSLRFDVTEQQSSTIIGASLFLPTVVHLKSIHSCHLRRHHIFHIKMTQFCRLEMCQQKLISFATSKCANFVIR